MDLGDIGRWLAEFFVQRLLGTLVAALRRLTARPAQILLRPAHAGDLRLVFSPVPREPASPFEAEHPEFNYLAGPNEVDFAWTLYKTLRRLVPPGRRLHPVTFSRQMYVEGRVTTVNKELWITNLIVSGSTKFNDVTRELHEGSSRLRLQLVFPGEGGAIVDRKHSDKRYEAERSNGEITADYGILAKYPNPYDPGKTIVLLAGIESVFQIGLTRTLANARGAKRLLKDLQGLLGGRLPGYFEALLRAPGRGLEFTGPLEVVEAYRLSTA